jgi:hypothetical protein
MCFGTFAHGVYRAFTRHTEPIQLSDDVLESHKFGSSEYLVCQLKRWIGPWESFLGAGAVTLFYVTAMLQDISEERRLIVK